MKFIDSEWSTGNLTSDWPDSKAWGFFPENFFLISFGMINEKYLPTSKFNFFAKTERVCEWR